MFFIDISIFSQSNDTKKYITSASKECIRVGYVERANFCEGSSDNEYKTGYAYEYLQKVSQLSGWTYEYVYGDWDEMIGKLERGEIDIMPGVSKTEDRLSLMSFPDFPMGRESYYIYLHSSKNYVEDGLAELKGVTVGTTAKSTRTQFLNIWNEEHDNLCNIKLYSGNEEMYRELASGNLTAIASTNNVTIPVSGMVPVEKIGASDYYLAVSNFRPDILNKLNKNLEVLNNTSPYYLEDLQSRYYSETKINPSFSDLEYGWLESHKEIYVGILSDSMPICGKDDWGRATGMLVDVFEKMILNLALGDRIKVKYKFYKNHTDMNVALHRGDVDVIFPVINDLWSAEQNGFHLSKQIASSAQVLVFKGRFNDSVTDSIAVCRTNQIQENYVRQIYKDKRIVFCDTDEQCFDYVMNGIASGTVIDLYRKNTILSEKKFNLNTVELPVPCGVSFGIRCDNTGLIFLIDRCIESLEPNYALKCIYRYQSADFSYSMKDFIRDNLAWIALSILLIVFIILVVILFAYLKERKHIQIQKQTQEELEKAVLAADEANRAKSTFMFSMSHDIRTPMNAIIGYTDLLKNHLNDRIKAESYLEKIQSSNGFLLQIINNVLEMARIDSGKMTIEEKYADINVFINTIISLFDEQMMNKEIRFTNSIDIIHKDVMVDDTKISGIFLNIIGNALKYTNSGGSVHVDVKERNSDREGYGIYQVSVSDTGIGMAEDFIPHIFEEFSREKTSTESKVVGTGLGMAIVSRYVNLLEGTIDVKSKVGDGSTFIITLPVRLANEDEIIAKEKKKGPVNLKAIVGKRILLAEDNSLNAEIASTLLNEFGLSVEVAENGKIAIEKLSDPNKEFDIILMDIQMPEMDGYTATERIRNGFPDDEQKRNIPIIAMTANAFAEDKKRALDVGMNGHIAKPIMPTELVNVLAEHIK